MTLIYILVPVLALSGACTGYGMLPLALFENRLVAMPIVVRFTAAYFLGQSLLAAFFLISALGGGFNFYVVMPTIVLGLFLCAFSCWRHRVEMGGAAIRAGEAWTDAPWAWKIAAALSALLFVYGLSTIGRTLEGDASAFYLAAAKHIAHVGRIASLPGYESFSWVIAIGEMVYASLFVLGAPGVSARFYEWVNFVPILFAVYSVARLCDQSARAAFLSVVIVLTSSAAISLWGGGKTDTFAVGPAFVGVWFALASWRSHRRAIFVALAGLFCGVAIITKMSYLPVLLPCVLLITFWKELRAAAASAKCFDWLSLCRQAVSLIVASSPFLLGLMLGFSPLVIKNLVVFHAPFSPGAGQLVSSTYFSKETTLRLILSYPFALTYGRYWAQLGTLSPLILAFFPLWFLMPRSERQLESPVVALTFSTVVALAIWLVLMPSVFMPRYILANLLLLGIPAAAGAAYVSRQRSVLSAMIVLATAITIVLTPFQVNSRSPIFQPGRAIDYLRTGQEEVLFVTDPYVSVTGAVNQAAAPNDRTLLLVYPRIWLRGDLLASTSTQSEVGEAIDLLRKRDASFWNYLETRQFKFVIVDAALGKEIDVAIESVPAGFGVCEISTYGGVTAFQLGKNCDACPFGERTALEGPFSRPWIDGRAFVASAPTLESIADSAAAPRLSPIVICEGDVRLRRPHTGHREIAADGRGRFSHWGKEVYFSATDNTDPNTNGRAYIAVKPR